MKTHGNFQSFDMRACRTNIAKEIENTNYNIEVLFIVGGKPQGWGTEVAFARNFSIMPQNQLYGYCDFMLRKN